MKLQILHFNRMGQIIVNTISATQSDLVFDLLSRKMVSYLLYSGGTDGCCKWQTLLKWAKIRVEDSKSSASPNLIKNNFDWALARENHARNNCQQQGLLPIRNFSYFKVRP